MLFPSFSFFCILYRSSSLALCPITCSRCVSFTVAVGLEGSFSSYALVYLVSYSYADTRITRRLYVAFRVKADKYNSGNPPVEYAGGWTAASDNAKRNGKTRTAYERWKEPELKLSQLNVCSSTDGEPMSERCSPVTQAQAKHHETVPRLSSVHRRFSYHYSLPLS